MNANRICMSTYPLRKAKSIIDAIAASMFLIGTIWNKYARKIDTVRFEAKQLPIPQFRDNDKNWCVVIRNDSYDLARFVLPEDEFGAPSWVNQRGQDIVDVFGWYELPPLHL